MRALLASLFAVAAMAFAAPSFAQQELPPETAPVPAAKGKSTAHCNKLKSADAKASCLKRMQTAKVTPAAKTTKKAAKRPPTAAAVSRPNATAAAPATAMPAPAGKVDVPPLPQKTI